MVWPRASLRATGSLCCQVPGVLGEPYLLHSLLSFPLGQLKLSIEVQGRILLLHSEYLPGVYGEVAPQLLWASVGDSTSMPFLQALWRFVATVGNNSGTAI